MGGNHTSRAERMLDAGQRRTIATLKTRIKHKQALLDRSTGAKQRIAKIKSKALEIVLEKLIEQSLLAREA